MRTSSTGARVDVVTQTNVTWQDAIQFDPPTDVDDDDPLVTNDGDNDADDITSSWTMVGQNFRLDIKGDEDTPTLLSITSGAGQIIVDDPINRILHFNVPEGTLNAALLPGKYEYDLIMYDNSSPAVRVCLMFGDFTLKTGITGG